MIVKLCGMRRVEDIEGVNRARPDYAGAICSPGFRRSVTIETAGQLRAALDPGIPLVGVFVNEEIARIRAFLAAGIIQVVQLHGAEDAAYLERLRQVTDAPIFKAFQIRQKSDMTAAMQSPADRILLDSGTGSGEMLDWSRLTELERPFLLAGGLTPENVTAALAQVRPAGVDVSSGIETDGWKDAEKMARFVAACRNWEETL
ncbi:MAG: phosphoribosylanthranilate isomerase [Oscillospiraceae bacterium]|nr:phosphoribosylanthranilate isomerase [Oscillospiraceae bacterium]